MIGHSSITVSVFVSEPPLENSAVPVTLHDDVDFAPPPPNGDLNSAETSIDWDNVALMLPPADQFDTSPTWSESGGRLPPLDRWRETSRSI